MNSQNEKILYSEDPGLVEDFGRPWKIMLVDDEQSIHDVTRLALSGFSFDNRPLEFVSVYSGEEARKTILDHPDTALILLDVVMESETAGLDVAQFIREEACNSTVRIVLRTGQPGQAPERDVIARYDINDYKEKTELTSRKLSTLMYASLRSYRDIVELEKNKRGLEAVIEASTQVFELQTKETLAQVVLEQLVNLLHEQCDLPIDDTSAFAAQGCRQSATIVAATGCYAPHVGSDPTRIRDVPALQDFKAALSCSQSEIASDHYTAVIKCRDGIKRLLHLKAPFGEPTDLTRSLLKLFERNVAIACENMDLVHETEQTQIEMVDILGETIETRSLETGHHVQRVAEISKLIALEYGLPEEEAEIIRLASPLHDIGKIGVPDAILTKPGKLTDAEWSIMKTHSMLGYDLLKSSSRKVLQAGAVIARDHHERWAGGGYPAGKTGEDIHLYGRITAIADVFDALGSERCYKKAWPLEDILELLRKERGRQFQPELVDILLANIDEIVEICEQKKD
jgi:response regulator RpfG family c-di-GMP phosphodiesterase